ERLTAILQVAFLLEIVHPGHPPLHALLRALGCAHRVLSRGFRRPVKIKKLAHLLNSFPWSHHHTCVFLCMTFEPGRSGHSSALPLSHGAGTATRFAGTICAW